MRDLSEIGFYTMSTARAKHPGVLYRCELILTNICNFRCPYCRNIQTGETTLEDAKKVVDAWAKEGLVNVRFSGGEPTTWKGLLELVQHTKKYPSVEHIAISTNGSASLEFYKKLIDAGVNDFSISLDACCASFGDMMAGNIKGAWQKVVTNIVALSKLTYVTVGVVVTEETVSQLKDTILFADSLGVSDIRIISAAQFNKVLEAAKDISDEILEKYPILKYRINNIRHGRNVRGLEDEDSPVCGLALDDMAVANGKHYPCIIYMREGGKPIGDVGPNMMEERADWVNDHVSPLDPICRQNCLDVCIDFNNTRNVWSHYSP